MRARETVERALAGHSGEEDVNKTTNLIRRSLLGIPAQEGN